MASDLTEQQRTAIAANAIAAILTERWGFVPFRLLYEIAHNAIERARPSPRLAAVLAAEPHLPEHVWANGATYGDSCLCGRVDLWPADDDDDYWLGGGL